MDVADQIVQYVIVVLLAGLAAVYVRSYGPRPAAAARPEGVRAAGDWTAVTAVARLP